MRTTMKRYIPQSRRSRSLLSSLAALLYVLCAIALPSLHVGFHRDDHEHRGGGFYSLRSEFGAHHARSTSPHPETHSHAWDAQSAGRPSDHRDPRVGIGPAGAIVTPARGGSHHTPVPEPGHGDGSLVHFAIAFVAQAEQAVLPLAGSLPEPARYHLPADHRPRRLIALPKEARGPPAPLLKS